MENPGVGAAAVDVEQLAAADPRDLAEALTAGSAAAAGQQLDLLGEDEALPDVLPVSGLRKRMEAQRARGRPAGAGNKRTVVVRDYLLRQGYAHPLEVLAAFASSTPDEVAAEMVGGTEALDRLPAKERVKVGVAAVAAIKGSAEALAPYFESKRPQELHIDSEARHLFVVGQIQTERKGDSALSLGGSENPFDINVLPEA